MHVESINKMSEQAQKKYPEVGRGWENRLLRQCF